MTVQICRLVASPLVGVWVARFSVFALLSKRGLDALVVRQLVKTPNCQLKF
jgi:hypothetical protein